MTFPKIYLATFIQNFFETFRIGSQWSAAGIFRKLKALDISLIIYHWKVFSSLVWEKHIRNSNYFSYLLRNDIINLVSLKVTHVCEIMKLPKTFVLTGLRHQGSFASIMSLDKSRMYVREVLEIRNFTNCCTWLFFNKYAHEHAFSFSWVRETIVYRKTDRLWWNNFKKLGVHVL